MTKYKISTIIPIYNVEKYLDKTIKSIINQSIGFDNIQLILVNDGSPDNSKEICLKYKNKYPNNIIYVEKENGGVSSARNIGMKYVDGEYIHFMDSDDLISKNAYKNGYKMLKENNVDIVCFRIKIFDGAHYQHGLDYRFSHGNKIVDLTKDYDYPLYHMPTALIKKKLVKGLELDTKLKVSEDVKFMSEIMTKTNRIGLLASETFYYRKRKNNSSAIQTSTSNKSFFFDTPKYSYDYVLSLAKKYPSMKNYFQNAIIGDLQWRIFNCDLSILSEDEKREYIESIRNLLLKIDDEIIVNQKTLHRSKMIRELLFKYNKNIIKNFKLKNDNLVFNNINILNLNNLTFNIYSLYVNNGKLNISGCFDVIYNSEYDIYVKLDDKEYVKFNKYIKNINENNLYNYDELKYELCFYDININYKKYNKIEFYIDVNGKKYKLVPEYSKFSKLNNLRNSYYKYNNNVFLNKDNGICISNKMPGFIRIKYLFELFRKKQVLPLGLLGLYIITYPFVKHDNWIIADRYDFAGDSAEHLFKYIKNNNNKRNIYFAIKKNTADYNKMKKIGKVLPINSIMYYIKYLNSELVVSSHIDGFINNPFGKKQIYLNSFIKRKFVFLQHGIIKDDLSDWLGKFNKEIDMFVCSTKREYESILKGNYMYSEDVVKLTGLPRYDNLLKNDIKEENIILLMPTWRSSLVGSLVLGTQNRRYNPNFKNTDYYKFYNGLINSKKLLKVLDKNKYKIIFALHPSMKAQLNDFEKNEFVDIIFYPNYQELFKKGKIMITDYSSVYFDFAYLRKPIIYTHFDINSVNDSHQIRNGGDGYFKYEKDGFGPVTYNLKDSVDNLILLIENGCKMEKKYRDRVENFFEFNDNKNCERVYNEIKKIMNIK